MSTSPLNGRLLTDVSLFQDGNDPVDATLMRDVVLNNLCHFADEFAQVRVNWSAGVTTYTNGSGYLTTRTTGLDTSSWFHIQTFGPFPIALRQSVGLGGASYRLRVRIAGASSAGNAVTFRAALTSYSAGQSAVNGELDDHIFEATTSSTSMGWLTGTSQGVNAWTTQIVVPSAYVGTWLVPVSTKTDIGSDLAAVTQCVVSLQVWAKTSNTASVPRLGAVYAAEWIGD
jgi:hypothetical protein